jgi:hypothetical protein
MRKQKLLGAKALTLPLHPPENYLSPTKSAGLHCFKSLMRVLAAS